MSLEKRFPRIIHNSSNKIFFEKAESDIYLTLRKTSTRYRIIKLKLV